MCGKKPSKKPFYIAKVVWMEIAGVLGTCTWLRASFVEN
jgi:hypothetical protein